MLTVIEVDRYQTGKSFAKGIKKSFKLWPQQGSTLTSRSHDGGTQTETEIKRDRQADRNSRCAAKTFSDSDSKYFQVTWQSVQAAHMRISSILCTLHYTIYGCYDAFRLVLYLCIGSYIYIHEWMFGLILFCTCKHFRIAPFSFLQDLGKLHKCKRTNVSRRWKNRMQSSHMVVESEWKTLKSNACDFSSALNWIQSLISAVWKTFIYYNMIEIFFKKSFHSWICSFIQICANNCLIVIYLLMF